MPGRLKTFSSKIWHRPSPFRSHSCSGHSVQLCATGRRNRIHRRSRRYRLQSIWDPMRHLLPKVQYPLPALYYRWQPLLGNVYRCTKMSVDEILSRVACRARYCYSNSVRPSVCILVLCRNACTHRQTFSVFQSWDSLSLQNSKGNPQHESNMHWSGN